MFQQASIFSPVVVLVHLTVTIVNKHISAKKMPLLKIAVSRLQSNSTVSSTQVSGTTIPKLFYTSRCVFSQVGAKGRITVSMTNKAFNIWLFSH